MRTVLVSGSDTGVGKTHVVAELARRLAAGGACIQIVKVVETGAPAEGDAACAQRLAGTAIPAFTLAALAAPLAPSVAARAEGAELSFGDLIARLRALPPCDWRLLEGAGGIATPIDGNGRDWADFAAAIAADAVVLVVPDRLGAINQGRLTHARAAALGLPAGVWLNRLPSAPASPVVAASNRAALAAAGVPLWSEVADWPTAHVGGVPSPRDQSQRGEGTPPTIPEQGFIDAFPGRLHHALTERELTGLRRSLRVTEARPGLLNLAGNDYLALAHDPEVAAAVARSAVGDGTSASASPLITGWLAPHARLVAELAEWHGFPCGLLWSSGYAANAAVLALLPRRGDLVLADRLVHHSMIAGLLRSGARLQRYEHLRLDHLEELLLPAAGTGRTVFVVTETVFSMDGDYPDLAGLAELKRRHGFHLIVDEAHALGWHGPEGAGLVRAAGVADAVDVLVGTLGKTLASGGAYTLFRDPVVCDHLVNFAGEFIYSTALSPLNVAAASAALARVRALAADQPVWHARSRDLRARLQAAGWPAPDGDSAIVPVPLGSAGAAVSLAAALLAEDILVGAVRPPTVPAGASRLRLSLQRTFTPADTDRLLAAMARWRASP
jgi:8-amino-7-oxononanoate synthase